MVQILNPGDDQELVSTETSEISRVESLEEGARAKAPDQPNERKVAGSQS